jgi:hypothetical protein
MADRLSELPDDLLRRVLHFTPLKEAVSTTALSRRWRAPLWRSSGAVNLVTCVESYGSYRGGSSFLSHYRGGNYKHRKEDEARFFYWRDDFLSEAAAALDAGDQGDAPITRLTLRLESRRSEEMDDFLNRDRREEDGAVVSRDMNLVDVLLSHRASRSVEELRLVFQVSSDHAHAGYRAILGTLPLETLRLLELSGCKGLYHYQGQAAAVVLPRLSTLRLTCCSGCRRGGLRLAATEQSGTEEVLRTLAACRYIPLDLARDTAAICIIPHYPALARSEHLAGWSIGSCLLAS